MEIADLKTIGELIADKISVEKIYCLNHADNNTYHLIIIIPASCGTKFTELEPFVRMVTNANKDITYTFYQTGEIRAALKKGNLLFHLACIEANLLYNKKDSPDLPQSKAENLSEWKREANAQFEDGAAKATAFLDGANFYSEKNDTGLTVFMLHQFIELMFRTLELALLAKEKKTHSITLHQALVTPLLPQLGVLFPADTSEEKEILKTLNNAYSAVRYEQNHQVNEAFIPTLFHRAYLLQKRAATIISELNTLLHIKIKDAEILEQETVNNQPSLGTQVTESSLSHNIEPMNLKNDTDKPKESDIKPELQKVVAIIVEYLNPDQIYVFGRVKVQSSNAHLFNVKKHIESMELHYDLLVISPLANPYGNNVQSIVNGIDGVTINLFVHNKEEVLNRLENRNRFFNTVIKYGNLVYLKISLFDKANIPRVAKDDNRNHTVAHSARRMFRATAILKAVELVKDDVFEVTVSLLSQSLEQACLGLIYSFLGYSPNLHSLSHLLSICNIFWPENEGFFPIQTPYDKKLLAILSQSHSELRYGAGKTIDPDDLNEVYLRCETFVLCAEKVYLSTLSELEIEDYEAVK